MYHLHTQLSLTDDEHKWGKLLQARLGLNHVGGPTALWLSKGCRHTPTKTKYLVGIVTSSPRKPAETGLETPKHLSQHAESHAPRIAENDQVNLVTTNDTTQTPTHQILDTNTVTRVDQLPILYQALEEERKIVIESPNGMPKGLDADTADILVLEGEEYITLSQGGLGLIAIVYREVPRPEGGQEGQAAPSLEPV
jgi:hypothetical protein